MERNLLGELKFAKETNDNFSLSFGLYDTYSYSNVFM